MKEHHPELVDDSDCKMYVKYPIPSRMLQKYRTLTSYSGGNGNELRSPCQIMLKKPVGFTVGTEGNPKRDMILNGLTVWSFCQTFKIFLGLRKIPADFKDFYATETKLPDEIVFKMLTNKRTYEENDLLTYLIHRADDDEFFYMSDWRIIAKLRGYKDLDNKDQLLAMLDDVVFELRETEEYRLYILRHEVEYHSRIKLELQRQKEAMEEVHKQALEVVD